MPDVINFQGVTVRVLEKNDYSKVTEENILDKERDKDYIELALKIKRLRLNPKKVSAALTFLLSMDLY